MTGLKVVLSGAFLLLSLLALGATARDLLSPHVSRIQFEGGVHGLATVCAMAVVCVLAAALVAGFILEVLRHRRFRRFGKLCGLAVVTSVVLEIVFFGVAVI